MQFLRPQTKSRLGAISEPESRGGPTKSVPIIDGEQFEADVCSSAAGNWPVIAKLAELTGILAGPAGERSRGIYCTKCRFGFHRDFGAYPVVEGRTSLANDFNDEVHRRECPHWSSYLDHPEAFFYSGEDGGRAVPAPPKPSLHQLC